MQCVPFSNEADSTVVSLDDNDLLWKKTEIIDEHKNKCEISRKQQRWEHIHVKSLNNM